MISRLVVNGCSYMLAYSDGRGDYDLSKKLNIAKHYSLAMNGSCNSRIIRTTLKDSYQTQEKTLYIVGLTFLKRVELPINLIDDPIEGRWLSISTEANPTYKYVYNWTGDHTRKFLELKLKADILSKKDHLETLQYQVLSMIADLRSRGHSVVVFKNPGDPYIGTATNSNLLGTTNFKHLETCVNIVHGLQWEAIPWQITQQIKFNPYDDYLEPEIRHPLPGEHGPLNNFLSEYIEKHALHLPVL